MHNCRICGWKGDAETVVAREMMIGTREEFTYFICPECKCLQIEKTPEDLGKYYSNESYYSFNKADGRKIDVEPSCDLRVLDVGCGAGNFLCNLYKSGYTNLTGCDPFLEEDIEYENGVRIFSKSIHEMDGEFDVIYMMDSFEHVLDPHEVFDSTHRLLAKNGILGLRIPVFPNIAYDIFGTNWYQLDAPRHICLHSKESIEYMAKKHGFTLKSASWNGSEWMIERSFFYQKDIPFYQQTEDLFKMYFPPEVEAKIREDVREANQNNYGDHADFMLIKN